MLTPRRHSRKRILNEHLQRSLGLRNHQSMSFAPPPGAPTALLATSTEPKIVLRGLAFHSHVEILDLPGSRMAPPFAHRLIDGAEVVELVPPPANTPPERRLASSLHWPGGQPACGALWGQLHVHQAGPVETSRPAGVDWCRWSNVTHCG